MKEKYTGEITCGDISRAEHFVNVSIPKKFNKNSIFEIDLKVIALEFLNYFIEEDTTSIPFDKLRNAFCQRFNICDDVDGLICIPSDENAFYKYICKNYLCIEENNIELVIRDIDNVIKDLREIHDNINTYKNKLKEIEKNNFYEGKNYEVKLFKYYIDKNKIAEEQVIYYLRNNLNISQNKNRDALFGNLGYIYPYAFNRYQYKVENLSEIASKFLTCNYEKFYSLEKLYREDRSQFFIEFKKVINIQEIIEKINHYSITNHRLNKRKELLNDILDLFKSRKFELFNNIVPLQIEGIIFDFCLEYGIKETSLVNSTLVDKINHIKTEYIKRKKFGHRFLFDFEYFSFIFPVQRNRVAHGNLVNQDDIENSSILLLLDLDYTCKLMFESDLQTNLSLNLIGKAEVDPTLINLINLGPVFEVGIDPFYFEKNKKLSDLKEKILEDLNLENFEKAVTNIDYFKIDEIKINLIKIKDLGINQSECEKIIKLLPRIESLF